jgi:riboflavin kinase/FMN adenylyltransferase
MQIIRHVNDVQPKYQNCVLAIGNFDGVHRGHQQLLQMLLEQARSHHGPAVLMTFEPTPQEYFAKRSTGRLVPARLTRWREKWQQLEQYNLAAMLCLRFNKKFAGLSAEQFVTNILIKCLHVNCVVVGEDFRFGYQRKGDIALLSELAKQYSFEVITIPAKQQDGHRVSSTRVRQALADGNFILAQQLLGRAYTMLGKVVKGDQRGRLLGFPTANIRLQRLQSPLQGVYAVKVHGLADKPLPGAANIGKRPTLDGLQEWLEVHLLDFQEDIYGRKIEVEFIAKIRDEQQFASKELLIQQLQQDIKKARQIISEKGDVRL